MRRQRVIDLQVLHVPVHLRSSMIIQCKWGSIVLYLIWVFMLPINSCWGSWYLGVGIVMCSCRRFLRALWLPLLIWVNSEGRLRLWLTRIWSLILRRLVSTELVNAQAWVFSLRCLISIHFKISCGSLILHSLKLLSNKLLGTWRGRWLLACKYSLSVPERMLFSVEDYLWHDIDVSLSCTYSTWLSLTLICLTGQSYWLADWCLAALGTFSLRFSFCFCTLLTLISLVAVCLTAIFNGDLVMQLWVYLWLRDRIHMLLHAPCLRIRVLESWSHADSHAQIHSSNQGTASFATVCSPIHTSSVHTSSFFIVVVIVYLVASRHELLSMLRGVLFKIINAFNYLFLFSEVCYIPLTPFMMMKIRCSALCLSVTTVFYFFSVFIVKLLTLSIFFVIISVFSILVIVIWGATFTLKSLNYTSDTHLILYLIIVTLFMSHAQSCSDNWWSVNMIWIGFICDRSHLLWTLVLLRDSVQI